MNLSSLRPLRGLFLVLAILGFVVINIPFLYFEIFEKVVYDAAIANGVALVFMGETLLLMIFFAFLIARLGWSRSGWVVFVLLSLVGSMAFSVPFFLYLQTRKGDLSE